MIPRAGTVVSVAVPVNDVRRARGCHLTRATAGLALAAFLVCLAPISGRGSSPQGGAAPLDQLDRYNVVWQTPSRDASGSMPIGNGEVGLNAWVEEDGDLLFYIARTDAWSEISRLLKLGRVRVSLSPNPFRKGQPIIQELKLRDGRIEIAAGEPGRRVTLSLFVDALAPVIHVIGQSDQPITVRASLEGWRTERRVLAGEELQSTWTMQQAPPECRSVGVGRRRRGAARERGHVVPPQRLLHRPAHAEAPGARGVARALSRTRSSIAHSAGASSRAASRPKARTPSRRPRRAASTCRWWRTPRRPSRSASG